jgi:rubrerythrin
MNLEKIYKYALQREMEGHDFFLRNAERMSHAVAKGIFKRLAAEEEMHIQFIQSLLDGLKEGTEPGEEFSRNGFFADRAESELLDQTVIESMTPDVTILRTAYLIERDFAEFYEMAASRTTGEAKKALLSLAGWERSHEALFRELHEKVFEEYTNMPWGG